PGRRRGRDRPEGTRRKVRVVPVQRAGARNPGPLRIRNSMIDVDITLSVNDGRRRFDLAARFVTDAPFVALYGPSGAGKSLTLQSVAGLVRPYAGHVRVAGRALFD